MQTLTNQAANTGALSPDEIKANQLQVDSILNSINRISNTTQFNGVKLLNGSLDYTTSGIASTAISVTQINAAKLPDNGTTIDRCAGDRHAQLGEVDFTGATVGTVPSPSTSAASPAQSSFPLPPTPTPAPWPLR